MEFNNQYQSDCNVTESAEYTITVCFYNAAFISESLLAVFILHI